MLVALRNNQDFKVAEGEIILDQAIKSGIYLQHSCRTGRCGTCKTQVKSGETTIIIPETSLNDAEIADGYILTCCRSAKQPLILDAESLNDYAAVPVKTLPCRIDELNYLADNVLQVYLRIPPKSEFKYIAGQYLNVIHKNGVKRSYSFACKPEENARIELFVKKVEGGALSQYWFHEAKVNDLLRINAPLGTFGLRDLDKNTIIFLATGTGIAPIKAMLEKMSEQQEKYKDMKIFIYWGARTESEIYWVPKYENLNFNFIPVLSRGRNDWQGYRGYVQNAVVASGINLENSVVYACGSDTMINSAYQLFTSKNLNQKYFYSDAFVESN